MSDDRQQTLFVDCDNPVEIRDLFDPMLPQGSRAVTSGVTIGITVKDVRGNEVGGVSWPVAITYDANTASTWRGIVPAAAELEPDSYYIGVIETTGASGRNQRILIPYVARERGPDAV